MLWICVRGRITGWEDGDIKNLREILPAAATTPSVNTPQRRSTCAPIKTLALCRKQTQSRN